MFDLACIWQSGFVMDPNHNQRYGFVTAVNGFGLPAALASDLTVNVPFNAGAVPIYGGLTTTYVAPTPDAPAGTARVVGVIERLAWSGGVNDPIALDFYVSAANAGQLRALPLTSKAVSALGWWIADFDQESKKWFEQAFPKSPSRVKGKLYAPTKADIRLDVDTTSVLAPPSIEVTRVSLEVAPVGDATYVLHFAISGSQKLLKSWGLLSTPTAPM